MAKRLTYEEVSEYFQKHECELLENNYVGSSIEMNFICKCGRYDKKNFNHFKRTNQCKLCNQESQSKKQTLSIDIVREIVEGKGFILVSQIYVNNRTQMEFVCPKGHPFKSTYSAIQSGKGCQECAGNRKYTIEQAKQLFISRGCELLTDKYVNANTSMPYKCKCGSEGQITLNKFKNRKNGCKHCNQKEENFIYKEYTKEDLIKEFWRYFNENGIYPRTEDMCSEKGYPSIYYYQREFVTWNYFLKEVVKVLGDKDWYICDEKVLKNYYFNKPQEFIQSKLIVKRKWDAIIQKANSMGLKRNIHSNGKEFFTKDTLIDSFWDYYYELKRFPKSEDFRNNKNYPNPSTITRHFGSWNNYLVEVGVVDKNTTDGWYIHDEALIRKYYPDNKIKEIINNLMIVRTEGTIRMKAVEMGIKVKKEIHYIPKYLNEETRNGLVNEAKVFYKENGRSPYRHELSYAKRAIEQNWESYNDFLSECGLPLFRRIVNLKTKEDGIIFLQNLKGMLGRNPFISDADKHGVHKNWFMSTFGSFKQALFEANLITYEELDEQAKLDKSIEGFKTLYSMMGKVPSFTDYKEYATENNLFHPNTLLSKTKYSTYVELCRAILGESNLNDYSEEELLNNLIELHEKLGRPPMGKELVEHGYPSISVYKTFFNKRYFNDIIRDLGWKPSGQDSFYKTDEELLEDYMNLFNKLGRVPLRDDIDEDDDMCSSPTYFTRFGGISEICDLLDLNYNELIADSQMGIGTSCFDNNGNICRSIAEMKITNILIEYNIKYVKEYPYSKITNDQNDRRRFDWYLPDVDVFIEYFGLFNKSKIHSDDRIGFYTRKTHKKIQDCNLLNKELIELYPKDYKNGFKNLINMLNNLKFEKVI